MIELIHGDCMEYLAGCKENQFDLAIVDPPYGIGAGEMKMGKGKNQKWKNGGWDNETPSKDYFIELKRISKNQIIWGGNYFDLPLTGGWIYWNKERNKDVSFSDGELAWTNFLNVIKQINCRYDGFIGADSYGRIHPTQKPVQLYRWLLQKYAKPGDTIFDPFGGSMSIAIACYIEGFDLVCIEKDKDYFDAAKKRYDTYVANNPRMFEPEDLRTETQGELF